MRRRRRIALRRPRVPRGTYCDSGLPGISLVCGLVLTFAGGALATSRRRWRPLAVLAAAGAALTVSPLLIGSALSKECSDKPVSMTSDEFQRYLEQHPDCAHY